MFRISALLRALVRTALIVYLAAAALFLIFRYGILPNIDHWRPRIQAELSSALDTPLTLGRIEAGWKGLHPHFELNDVALFDVQGKQVLGMPRIRAKLSWRGLLSGLPRFSYIEALGLDIEARRDAQHRIWILGKDIDVQDGGDSSELALDDPAVQWLAQQPRVVLRDAAITWRDETRDASPLRLAEVTVGLESELGLHRMVLSATPPQALGRRFELRARFEQTAPHLARTDPEAWAGVFYVHVDGMSPVQWKPWVDVPGNMRSGDVSARWWLTFAQAEVKRMAAQVSVGTGQWSFGDAGRVHAHEAELFLDGSVRAYGKALRAFEAMLALGSPVSDVALALEPDTASSRVDQSTELVREPDRLDRTLADEVDQETNSGERPVLFEAVFHGLTLEAPDVFDHALSFERIILGGNVRATPARKLAVRFENAHVFNQDMDLVFSGTWSEGGSGKAGLADIQGLFRYASLDGIDLYMPDSVNLDARQWLVNGLLDGQLENAAAVLQGDLEHFPFGDGSGQFRIAGRFRDGVIDYAPGPTEETAWPALRQVQGYASLDRVDLRLVADEAVVYPTEGQVIRLHDVRAHIPNIERNSVLNIEGETQAPAPAYLALARHSPLKRLLDGFLDPAQADGEWEVPLRLTIPLLDVDDTRVRGAVLFQGGTVMLEPEAPPFEQVRGTLEFSETGFSADGLSARFLGGPADFSGGVGGVRKGLDMRGSIGAKALTQYVGMQGMERLEGEFAYRAQLRRQASGRYAMVAQSDLQGLAVDMPAPVGKPAQASSMLEIQWTPAPADSQMYLDIALGEQLRARFLRHQGRDEGPYFRTGVIGTSPPDHLPSASMLVDVRYPHIDINDWNAIVNEFSTPLQSSNEPGRELFPPLERVRLQADSIGLYGLQLDTATLTAQREQPLQWRMDLASAKTAGTLFWNRTDTASSGRIEARFDRLVLGDDADAKTSDTAESTETPPDALEGDDGQNEEIDIPEVDLQVDKLTLYDRFVGKLAVEGLSEQGGRFWRLNKLSLTNPSAQLQGSGIWRLAGPQRGLTLDADVQFSDAGAFLDQIKLGDVMEDGHGSLKGRFEWRNMPWRFDRSDLNGQLRLELEQGRFSTLNARSARLLELLSLQSIQRIATLNLNPASIFKEGFPFDRLAGTLHIQDGVMTTNDYRVNSPVATISIAGDVDIKTEKIALQAMVVPHLDVSGATVAAGIAINPIVGLGAFVTQWLLSKPLSKAMTVHYDVTGDLNSPQLREVAAPLARGDTPQAAHIQGHEVELDDGAENGLRDAKELERADHGLSGQ